MTLEELLQRREKIIHFGQRHPEDRMARADLEQINKAIEQTVAQYNKGPGTSPGEGVAQDVAGAGYEVAQGATMGAADEIVAGQAAYGDLMNPLAALVNKPAADIVGRGMPERQQDYANTMGAARGVEQHNQGDFPLATRMGLNFMGALPGGVGVARNAPGLFSSIPRTIGTNVAAGATAGALSAPEDQRLEGGVIGGLLGGGITAGVEGIGAAGRNFLGPLLSEVKRSYDLRASTPEQARGRVGSEVFDIADQDPEAILAKSESRPGENPLAAEDPTLLQAARYGVERGGKAAQVAEQLNEATRGTAKRLADILREQAGPVTAGGFRQAILKAKQTTGNELYEKAYAKPVELTGELAEQWKSIRMKGRPWFREVKERAEEKYLAETGKSMTIPIGPDTQPTLAGWQAILEEMRTQAQRAGGDRARDISANRRRIIKALEDQVPEYGAARQFWRGQQESEELVDLGYKLIQNPTPSKVDQLIADIELRHGRDFDPKSNASDRDLIVAGMAEALEDKLAMVKGSADLDVVGQKGYKESAAMLDRQATQDVIERIFGKDSADDLYKWVSAELNKHHVANTLTHAAGTSRQGALKERFTGRGIRSTSQGLASDTVAKLRGTPDTLLDDISQALMVGDPERKRRFIQEIIEYRRGKVRKPLRPEIRRKPGPGSFISTVGAANQTGEM